MVPAMIVYQIRTVLTYMLKNHLGTEVKAKELNRIITSKQFI